MIYDAVDNMLIVISSPSGAGKTTIANYILANDTKIKLSTSVTTRQKRNGEIDGKSYIFIDDKKFDDLIADNQLIEFEKIFDNRYGTPKNNLINDLQYNDVLLDINWQGANSIKNIFPNNSISIFILPPSLCELERRIVSRGLDSVDIINKRLTIAKIEIKKFQDYDYVVVNDNLQDALYKITCIIASERCKSKRAKLK